MFSKSVFVLAASLPVQLAVARLYTITNRCPTSVELYINGEQHETLDAYNGRVQKTYPETWSGFIYTGVNGGDPATGNGITRAGFYGDADDYYIVRDPQHFNIGVQIIPQYAPAFCGTADCGGAFAFPPVRIPPSGSTPPTAPMHSCPGDNFAYNVVFCPSGSFPPPFTTVAIHPNGNNNKCLQVRGPNYADGTPVDIYDCNGNSGQKWTINNGDTKVASAGTGFCLDAGSNPGSGVGMKIWTCYNNLPAQAWTYTADKRVALTGKGQCLDLTNGVLTNGNRVQTYQCFAGNTNQIWTTTSW